MKLRALEATAVALALAGLGAATAFALPQPGKHPHPGTTTVATATVTVTVTVNAQTDTDREHGHKPPSTGPGCRPAVSLNLKGTANADATPPTLQVNVTGGNHWAKPFFASNTSTLVTVTTDGGTKVVDGEDNSTSLSSIKKGDRVLVEFRDCKADVKGKNAAALLPIVQGLKARMVVRLGG